MSNFIYSCLLIRLKLISVLFIILFSLPSFSYEGFGRSTTGNTTGTRYYVRNLSDSGTGSLRDALSSGNRTVDLTQIACISSAPVINLLSAIIVRGANITFDGRPVYCSSSRQYTKPLTLYGAGLTISGLNGARNIIVRNIRIDRPRYDGISIGTNPTSTVPSTSYTENIVVDRVLVRYAGDGSIDITGYRTRNVTVTHSILAYPINNKNMLVGYMASRVSLHHNIFVSSDGRNPKIQYLTVSGYPGYINQTDPEISADIRFNIIYDFGGGRGTEVATGSRINLFNNYYSDGDRNSVVTKSTSAPSALIAGAGNRYYSSSGSFTISSVINTSTAYFQGTSKAAPAITPLVSPISAVSACNYKNNIGPMPMATSDLGFVSIITCR